MLGPTISFDCPHCGTGLEISIDITGGDRQDFAYDCETCCAPIYCSVTLADGEVEDFTVGTGE